MLSPEPREHYSMVLSLPAATRCGNVAAGVARGRAAAAGLVAGAVQALAGRVPLGAGLDEASDRPINLEAVRQTSKAPDGTVQDSRAEAHPYTSRLGQLWMATAPAVAEVCLTFALLRSCETAFSRIIGPAKAVVCTTCPAGLFRRGDKTAIVVARCPSLLTVPFGITLRSAGAAV